VLCVTTYFITRALLDLGLVFTNFFFLLTRFESNAPIFTKQNMQYNEAINLCIKICTLFLDVICEYVFCTSPKMMLPKNKETSYDL